MVGRIEVVRPRPRRISGRFGRLKNSEQKLQHYESLLQKAEALLGEESDPITWMASLCCLLKQEMGFFWVGFYRVKGNALLIGPYQGSFGCLHISFDRGVCGACATSRKTVVVPDVHAFPGHIACDHRACSEIVVPVLDSEGNLRAVLDVDSDNYAAFDETDQKALERLVGMMKDLAWTDPS